MIQGGLRYAPALFRLRHALKKVFGVVVNSILGAKRMEEYDRLKELVEAAADDVAKATGGNKAAGTRVRKSMQEVKDAAQTVRKKILEVRSQQPS